MMMHNIILAMKKYFYELLSIELQEFCSQNLEEIRDHAIHLSKQTAKPSDWD